MYHHCTVTVLIANAGSDRMIMYVDMLEWVGLMLCNAGTARCDGLMLWRRISR